MRTRSAGFVDLENLKEIYAIEIFVNGKWCMVAEGEKPLLFENEEERNAKRAELRKMKWSA